MKQSKGIMEKCRDDFLKCDEVDWYNGSDRDAELWLSTNAVDWLEEGFFCMENYLDPGHAAFLMRFDDNKRWWIEYRQIKRKVEKWSKKLNHYPKSRFDDGYDFRKFTE